MKHVSAPCAWVVVGMMGVALASAVRGAEGDGKLEVREFAKTGMVGSVVGLSVDHQGRVYLTHTYRRNNGAIDIRRHRDWVPRTLGSRSVEDKRTLIVERYKDLAKLPTFKEKVLRLTDSNGDGIADQREVFYEGFNTEVHGLAGGVLAIGGDVFVTCIPGFYRLRDTNNDGKADEVKELVHGFGIHIGYGGHDMHGPTMGVDGRIYWSIGDKGQSVTTADGARHFYPVQGAAMRIERDGTGFEVFAHGLRNPQELAFDEWGNLFTVDNDGDFGDQERFHFVVEGTDTGWRSNYQYRSEVKVRGMTGYNPWLADGLWKPWHAGQPAYITPALSNFSVGPIGIAYNPGTALNARYRRHFFLAESNKQMQAFGVEPVGAGFKMVGQHVVFKGAFIIGVEFGPDGKLYLGDWGDNAWAPHEKGRVLVMDDPAAANDPLRLETRELLREGMRERNISELEKLIGHADQRVRLEAQFELAGRGEKGLSTLVRVAAGGGEKLKQVHGVWGVGQLARKTPARAKALVPLLNDADAEIRTQAVKMIGDAGYEAAADRVAELLADGSPRVRLHAGVALRKLGKPVHFDAAVRMLAENNDRDAFLRHAGVMALTGICKADRSRLVDLAAHPLTSVRTAAVVALRRLEDPGVARFLFDLDPNVAAEAGRAIHDDESIAGAMGALARVLERDALVNEPLVRRAISANLRVGDTAAARRLAEYAASERAPEAMRVMALTTLSWWTDPPELDDVQGYYRGLKPREAGAVHAAMDRTIGALLGAESKRVREATTRAISALKYGNAEERVTRLALDESQTTEVRMASLEAMAALKAKQLTEALKAGLADESAELRAAALRIAARVAPDEQETFAAIERALDGKALAEQQAALQVLGGLKSQRAATLVERWSERLLKGEVAEELALDVVEAAKALKSGAATRNVEAYEAKLATMPLGVQRLALAGGDAATGRELFVGSITAQCARCHKVGEAGGEVGPDLTKVAQRLNAEKLLESMINPQVEIAEGFGIVAVTLKDGQTLTGTLKSERDAHVELALTDGTSRRVENTAIASRTTAVSAMPPMVGLLKTQELRDLVAYLKTLK